MTEQEVFSNIFGTVTDKSIIITTRDGVESTPTRQVSSVSFERHQNKVLAVVCFIMALVIPLFGWKLGKIGGRELVFFAILSIVFLLAGIANFIGHHLIILKVAGKELKPIKVEISKTKEGLAYYQAIMKQIISQ